VQRKDKHYLSPPSSFFFGQLLNAEVRVAHDHPAFFVSARSLGIPSASHIPKHSSMIPVTLPINPFLCEHNDDIGTKLQMNRRHDIFNHNLTSYSSALEFSRQCGKLKKTPRAGWVRRNITQHLESVADHSWRVSIMCLLLSSQNQIGGKDLGNIDVQKCIQLATVHDLAECITGDICPDDNVSKKEKYKLEHEAILELANLLDKTVYETQNNDSETENDSKSKPSKYLLDLWYEYEARETEEAKAVKDLDLLDMILQADEYEQQCGPNSDFLQEFFDGTMPHRFQNDYLKKLASEVHIQRRNRLNSEVQNDRKEFSQKKSKESIFSGGGTMKSLDNSDTVLKLTAQDYPNRQFREISKDDYEFINQYSMSSGIPEEELENIIVAYLSRKQ